MSENVNLTWIHTMHPYAEIHNVMSELIGNVNKTSEQHRELGVARIARDVKDLQIIHSWFTENFHSQKKLNLRVSLRVLLFHKILTSTVIEPMKLVQKFSSPSIIKHTHLQKCPGKRRLLR